MTKKFDQPARKIFINDFKYIKEDGNEWFFKDADLKFDVSLVWLQGHIKSIDSTGTKIVLSEDTSSVQITGCNAIPGGNQWMKQGMYCMVVGELESGSGMPTVKAFKITDLSSNGMHMKSWEIEVKEHKALIRENKVYGIKST